MNWTEERVEALKKLWAEGLSASQIAAQLGGVSRNAVIGKVHRLKLSGRGRAQAAPARPKSPAKAQPPVKAPPKAPVPPARVVDGDEIAVIEREPAPVALAPAATALGDAATRPESRMLDLIDLNERTCKWPIGDPLAPGFHFCGAEASETGPYCRYHARIAFQPPADRRRR
ncbi:MAG: GcrA cell cycle regulator [Rhizobiaceae bacterium]|nr:GcrA cell cycle regulator [Rhizobiaceae bacterium]